MLSGLAADIINDVRRTIYGMGGQPPEWVRKTATTTGITQGTGIVWFDLEPQLKRVFPAHAPIRNETPRIGLTGPGFGTAANWRSLVNINNSNVLAFVAEGKRGGQIQYQELDRLASYKGFGLESFVNFEAEYAALGFDDILDTATTTLLMATMVEEEKLILWGNTSQAFGGSAPAAPTVTDGGGSGSDFTATLQSVEFVALTPLGVLLAGGLVNPGTTTSYTLTQAVVDQISRTNADGTSDTLNGGHGVVSSVGTVTPTSGHNLSVTAAGITGAGGYAWYLKANAGATFFLAAITAIPKVTFTNTPNAANQQPPAGLSSDRSTNSLAFDGLITQALTASGWGVGGIFNQYAPLSPSAGGAYVKSLAGAALTFSGNTCVEIDAALEWMWEAYKVYPDEIWVAASQAKKITNGIAGSTAPTYRIEAAGQQGRLIGGALVTQYINKFALGGATTLPIRIHPYMPDGWVFLNTKTLADKLPITNVSVPYRIKARREYYSVAWPVTTRQRQYGVYADEVLEHYAPFAMGLIQDAG